MRGKIKLVIKIYRQDDNYLKHCLLLIEYGSKHLQAAGKNYLNSFQRNEDFNSSLYHCATNAYALNFKEKVVM